GLRLLRKQDCQAVYPPPVVGEVLLVYRSARESVDQGLQLGTTVLHGSLIDDQARGNGGDVFHFHQLVGTQGASAGDQVHNGVGQTDQRSQFHGAIQLDQVHIYAFAGEVFAGSAGVFGGDTQARTLLDGRMVVKAFGHGNTQAATGNVQVHGLVQTAGVLFHVLVQHILAGNSDMGGTVLHVGWHVGGTHNNQTQVRVIGGQD